MATTQGQETIKDIFVRFEKRPDGGLRAYCDEVPNFVLSHSDPEALMADVEPALEVILSAMHQAHVEVTAADKTPLKKNSGNQNPKKYYVQRAA